MSFKELLVLSMIFCRNKILEPFKSTTKYEKENQNNLKKYVDDNEKKK
jgi:hypothetical protein